MNGMYKVAQDRSWGFDAAFNLTGREAFPQPFFAKIRTDDGKTRRLQAFPMGDTRGENIHLLDFRAAKTFTAYKANVTIGVDCYNALGADTMLQQQLDLSTTTAGNTLQTISPRIFRVGAQFRF
jgi:hypothetical protein